VRALALPTGTGYAWLAAESTGARRIRQYLFEERGFSREQIKAAGYWRNGEAGAHEAHID
jgi:NADPH-dependent ferric siderophore reductase